MLRNNKIISIKNFQLKVLMILCLFSFSKSWGQATLPLSRTAWGGVEPTGWTNSGCTQRNSTFACTGSDGTIFDTNGDSRTVFFSSAPDQLVFKLKSSSMSGASSLLVQESPDGSTWTNIGNYGTASGATSITDCNNITITLNCLSRYVKWTYTKSGGNCDMDDVSVSSFTGTCSGACSAPTTTITPTTQTVCAGTVTTISVTSSAASNTYTWQASATSGGVYSNVSNGTPAGSSYSGTNTAVLSLTAGATYYYRCLVTDVTASCTATSGTSTLVVNTTPTISTQPSSTVVCQGSTATIKVTMNSGSSSPLTYQWQENTGSGFTNISIGSPYTVSVGTNTSTLNVDNTKPIGTYTYQCIVSNSCGTVTTNIVTVTITATPANDLCSSATPIVIDAPPVIGSLNCASPSSGLTYAATKNDVWFAFTPTCTASHTVTMNFTTSGADYDLDVFTTGACPASGTATYTSHGTTTVETISQTFTSGVTYYIRVIDYNTSGGTFSVSVVSNCGSPHVVTFNSNGGTGSMSNQTSSSATSLTSNAYQ